MHAQVTHGLHTRAAVYSGRALPCFWLRGCYCQALGPGESHARELGRPYRALLDAARPLCARVLPDGSGLSDLERGLNPSFRCSKWNNQGLADSPGQKCRTVRTRLRRLVLCADMGDGTRQITSLGSTLPLLGTANPISWR
jgi:hypothetical protein